MDQITEDFIHYAMQIGAIEIVPEGRKLKSGRMSPYFFNAGLFTTGYALSKLLSAYAIAWDNHPVLSPIALGEPCVHVDVIFGPAYKGIPLSVGLTLSAPRFADYGWAFNRKEEKDHGDGGTLVGASMASKNVLIMDDVMTSGISSAEAVEIVRAAGGTPVGTLIAFDRQEVGQDGTFSAVEEFERKFEIPVAAAVTLQELIVYLEKEEHPAVAALKAYRSKYGVFANDMPIDEGRGYQLPG
jgi:orotate phosphoribosyltransferase